MPFDAKKPSRRTQIVPAAAGADATVPAAVHLVTAPLDVIVGHHLDAEVDDLELLEVLGEVGKGHPELAVVAERQAERASLALVDVVPLLRPAATPQSMHDVRLPPGSG